MIYEGRPNFIITVSYISKLDELLMKNKIIFEK